MIPAPNFLDACHAQGIRFITGTPCSYLQPLINAAIGDWRFLFGDAVNEGDAVTPAEVFVRLRHWLATSE
jgi:phosphonopyruvate decarboxylase